MVTVKPPSTYDVCPRPWVFLAGSIEMDKAERWQDRMADLLSSVGGTILNPRRDEWDASWKQEMSNPNFRGQVEWELDGQEAADQILMYFDPATKAPITLLELGMFANSGKLVVCCPPGFWRRGNVEIVCARHNIPMVNDLKELSGLVLPRRV